MNNSVHLLQHPRHELNSDIRVFYKIMNPAFATMRAPEGCISADTTLHFVVSGPAEAVLWKTGGEIWSCLMVTTI